MIIVKTYKAPTFNKSEILRYAGVKSDFFKKLKKEDKFLDTKQETVESQFSTKTNTIFDSSIRIDKISDKKVSKQIEEDNGSLDSIISLMESCIEEVRNKLTYKVCYETFSISACGEYLDLEFTKTTSKDLRKNLKDCESVILFSATIGMEIDRLIARYSRISPVKALLFQAIGAERIESLCDMFNKDIKEQVALCGMTIRPRFSAGYGDLPLEMQREIFQTLDCARKIGVSLNESLLMSPSKSVTAFIGVVKQEVLEHGEQISKEKFGCCICDKKNCMYRFVWG
ncbi:MAG: Vitamin B12 dependent methionine synthase activation subunit [Lachnospiraceae bacterium]|nr:Vitamin B12 dependent methionine synthase activation subunit [Lachnospiraceae bacterium]